VSIVTISRMFGSGGSAIAARVAQTLGWQLLDNAVVDAVAARLGVSPGEIEEREERVSTLAQRLADTLALGAPELLPASATTTLPPSEERIAEVTARVIADATARGHTVLVGRGAQSVLAERADVLHVLCYAPHAALVARAAARLGIPERDAARLVDETNRQREQYVKKYFGRSWLGHENYHLCLNTDWLGLDGTAEIIIRLARERFGL
jgi:cytidylate kinase